VAQGWLICPVLPGHTVPIGQTDPIPPKPRTMSDLQTLTANLNELQKQFVESFREITSQIESIKKEDEQKEQQQKKEEELIAFHDYLIDVVTETTGDAVFAKLAVSRLNQIRRNPTLSYHNLVTIYREIDENDITKRQAMLTLSKVYRYKFARVKDHRIKSEIKYATKCPHCGAMASRLVDRLRQDGVAI